MVDYSKIAFHSNFKYMRKFNEYELTLSGTPGEGSITHDLGYVPFFEVWVETGTGIAPVRTGAATITPSAFHIINATTTTISIAQDNALPATKYYIKVYEDPTP